MGLGWRGTPLSVKIFGSEMILRMGNWHAIRIMIFRDRNHEFMLIANTVI